MADLIRGHEYHPAGPTDSRCPCPALNVLANHNLIPHDGKNLSPPQLVKAIKQAYNLSTVVAWLLAFTGWLLCRRKWFTTRFDLGDLALHNAIEHDVSLAHADAPKGEKYAPTTPDGPLLNDLLARCPATGLGFEEMCKLRAERENALGKPLGWLPKTLGCTEAVLALRTLKDKSGRVPQARLEEWFGHERLPVGLGWETPKETLGVVSFLKQALKVKKHIAFLKKAKRSEREELLS